MLSGSILVIHDTPETRKTGYFPPPPASRYILMPKSGRMLVEFPAKICYGVRQSVKFQIFFSA